MMVKKFREFTYKSDIDDIKQDTSDVFDYLRDYGFDVEVETYTIQDENKEFPNGYIEEEISFDICKSDPYHSRLLSNGPFTKHFLIEGDSEESVELKETVLRARDIMKDCVLHMNIRYDRVSVSANPQMITQNADLVNDVFVTPETSIQTQNYSDRKQIKVDFPILLLTVIFTRRIGIDN